MIKVQLPDGNFLEVPTDDRDQAKLVAARYFAEK